MARFIRLQFSCFVRLIRCFSFNTEGDWMRRTYRLTACFVIVSILAFGLIAAHSATTWQKAAQLNTGRNQFAGAVVDGKIYVFGGNSKTGSSPLTSTEMFDPAAGKWVYEAENEDNGGLGCRGTHRRRREWQVLRFWRMLGRGH